MLQIYALHHNITSHSTLQIDLDNVTINLDWPTAVDGIMITTMLSKDHFQFLTVSSCVTGVHCYSSYSHNQYHVLMSRFLLVLLNAVYHAWHMMLVVSLVISCMKKSLCWQLIWHSLISHQQYWELNRTQAQPEHTSGIQEQRISTNTNLVLVHVEYSQQPGNPKCNLLLSKMNKLQDMDCTNDKTHDTGKP